MSLMTDTNFSISNIIFQNYNLCKYCIFRIKQSIIQSSNNSFIKEEFNKSIDENQSNQTLNINFTINNQYCSLCFNLSDPDILLNYIHSIKEKISQAGYLINSFQLGVTIPSSILVREKYILAKLKILEGLKIQENSIMGFKKWLRKTLGLLIAKTLDLTYDEESPFQITLILEHESTLNEPDFLEMECNEFNYKPKFKKQLNSQAKIIENLRLIQDEVIIQLNTNLLNFNINEVPIIHSIDLFHQSIFIGSRYCKHQRNISQTPWILRGIKKTLHSVQELIEKPILNYTHGKSTGFISSGREDADVRMLGTGRPFVLEIIDPKRIDLNKEVLLKLTNEINYNANGLVSIQELEMINKEKLKLIKEGEETKKKHYRCLIWSKMSLNEANFNLKINQLPKFPILIQQNTPLRVLHRRSPMIRPKHIYDLKFKILEEHFLQVDMIAEAGTYIKEFVHGDLNRTQPNLKDLLQVDVLDLLELDVIHIDLEFP